MTITKYRSGSPYYLTPQTSWYLDNLVMKDFSSDPTDKFMVLSSKYENRPYNLSYDLYGTKDYWWLFMLLNPDTIKDPVYDFKAGLKIRYALKERVMNTTRS